MNKVRREVELGTDDAGEIERRGRQIFEASRTALASGALTETGVLLARAARDALLN